MVTQPALAAVFNRLARRLSPDRFSQDDLTQEALVHYWKQSQTQPGQTQSWYVKSCWFHMRDRLKHGRSLDAPKRTKGNRSLVLDPPFPGDFHDHQNKLDHDLFAEQQLICDSREEIYAADEILCLSRVLKPVENRILRLLLDGFTTREAATRLSISHVMVLKHKKRIAQVASTVLSH